MIKPVWIVLERGHTLVWKEDTIEVREGFGLEHVEGFAYPSQDGTVVAVVARDFLPTLQGILSGEGR